MVFLGNLMIITGGRARNIQDNIPTEIYDTESSEWKRFPGLNLFRHSCFVKDSHLYIYGGFENTNPNIPIEKLIRIDLMQYFASNQTLLTTLETILLNSNSSNERKTQDNNNNNILLKYNNFILLNNSKQDQKFRLSNQAVVAKFNDISNNENMSLIRKVSIDKLNDESKRIGFHNNRSLIQQRRVFNEDLINKFVEVLLRPNDWYKQELEEIHNNLPFSIEEIDCLINEAFKVFSRDGTVVYLKTPVKVFGNLNGQYNDLMRSFESYNHPSDDTSNGDIHVMQYIFLGDICDRGLYSLEIVLLIFALKVNLNDNKIFKLVLTIFSFQII